MKILQSNSKSGCPSLRKHTSLSLTHIHCSCCLHRRSFCPVNCNKPKHTHRHTVNLTIIRPLSVRVCACLCVFVSLCVCVFYRCCKFGCRRCFYQHIRKLFSQRCRCHCYDHTHTHTNTSSNTHIKMQREKHVHTHRAFDTVYTVQYVCIILSKFTW